MSALKLVRVGGPRKNVGSVKKSSSSKPRPKILGFQNVKLIVECVYICLYVLRFD